MLPGKGPSQDVLNLVGIDAILQQYLAGVTTIQIARGLSVDPITLHRWLNDNHPQLIAGAREIRAEALVQEMLDIADDDISIVYTDVQGTTRVDPGAASMAKLAVDTRWKIAQATARRLYGNSAQVDVSVTVNPLAEAIAALRERGSALPIAAQCAPLEGECRVVSEEVD